MYDMKSNGDEPAPTGAAPFPVQPCFLTHRRRPDDARPPVQSRAVISPHPTRSADLRNAVPRDTAMHIDSLLAETDRLARVGRLRAAANLLEEHLVAEPDCIPALQMLARIWRLQHRPADAIPLLKRVLALQVSKRMAGVAAKVAGATVPAPSMSDADSEVFDAKDWDLLRSQGNRI